MALELLGGALLGAAVSKLLEAVIDAKEKSDNFQKVLTRLESTLKSATPVVNEIIELNCKLNLPNEEMKQLIAVLESGHTLVHKCPKISTINIVGKRHYSKKLHDLDYSLLRYFQTILPLDHLRDGKEMLVMTRELHMQLVGAAKDEHGESSSKSNEVEAESQPRRQVSNKKGIMKRVPKIGDIKVKLSLTPQVKFIPLSMKIGGLKISL